MSANHGIERVGNLVEFFRDELTLAFQRIGVETSQETEAYVVHLLDSYLRLDPTSAEELGFEKPAALLLEEALASDGDHRIEIYRRLGDASLYNCGFFSERLSRKVGPEYYQRIGRTAYKSLEEMMGFKAPGGVFHAIYQELAVKFDQVVAALRMLGSPPTPSDPFAQLYAGFFSLPPVRD